LVATDFSENAQTATQVAARRAKITDSALTLVHSLGASSAGERWSDFFNGAPYKEPSQLRREAIAKLETSFQSLVPECERPDEVEFVVALEDPEETIQQMAPDYELVVVGARGKGPFQSMLLGSTSERVVRSVDTPVLVVPHFVESEDMDHILAPVDFSECSRVSLRHAIRWANDYGAKLTILHTYTLPLSGTSLFDNQFSPSQIQSIEQERRHQLEGFVEDLKLRGLEPEFKVSVGYPYHVIFNMVDDQPIDLIAMGTHSREGVERLFLGSNAVKILRKTPTSVLTIRNEG
jgi:nucleotide-binding universal stress UspA family protein